MKKFKKIIALSIVGVLAVAGLAACGNSGSGTASDDSSAVAEATEAVVAPEPAAPEDDMGFTEVEIFSGVEEEFLNLNAVYFQPVDMTGGYNAEDSDCHL